MHGKAGVEDGDGACLGQDFLGEGLGQLVFDTVSYTHLDVYKRQGSEVALQAADVALLSEDMQRLALAHALARRTARIIRQNLSFAIGAMVVLVVAGLFFALPLPLAVIGHEGGTVLVLSLIHI